MSDDKSNILIKGSSQIQTTQTTENVVEQVAEESTPPKVDAVEEVNTEVTDAEKSKKVDTGVELQKQDEVAPIVKAENAPKVKSKSELLAEYGLDEAELDSLRKEKESKFQPAEEDKAFAELTDYLIKTKKGTKEDILQYESIKNTDETTLVFDAFAKKMKSEYPDASAEDIQLQFDEEYFINSENEKLKAVGVQMISKEAAEIKKPITEKFDSVKKEFVITSNMANFKSQQETIVTEFNKNPIKSSVNINGEVVEFEVMPDISITELQNHLVQTEEGKVQNNMLFSAFVENRELSEQALGSLLHSMAAKKMEQQKLDTVAKLAFEKAEQLFKDKLPGVKAPFKAKEEIAAAKDAKQVNELDQWKRFKDK